MEAEIWERKPISVGVSCERGEDNNELVLTYGEKVGQKPLVMVLNKQYCNKNLLASLPT